MGYDTNVTSSVLQLSVKRRVDRIDFRRPPVEGNGSLRANIYLRETRLDATAASPRSGSIVSDSLWMIEVDRSQILGVTGVTTFLNGMISLANDLKDEFDENGTLVEGRINKLAT